LIHELEVHHIELELQNRELREAQSLLEESQQRYCDLYDFAPLAYCTIDRFGRVREANLAACELFGVPRATLVGRPLNSIVSIEDHGVWRLHLRRVIEERAAHVAELPVVVKDRARVVLQLTSTPVVGGDGTVDCCKVAFTDVTLFKRVELRQRLL